MISKLYAVESVNPSQVESLYLINAFSEEQAKEVFKNDLSKNEIIEIREATTSDINFVKECGVKQNWIH